MEEKLQAIFAKHYKRIENDLKNINGYIPLFSVVLSSDFRNLESDILNEVGKANGNK